MATSSSSLSSSVRTVLTTGANTGIGFGIVKNLSARPGFHVLLGARDVKKGEEALKSLQSAQIIHANSKVEVLQIDITNEDSVKAAAEKVKAVGGLDILINNAGMAYKGSIFNEEVARNTIATNYFGTVRALQHFTPLLKPNARVVNVSSTGGQSALGSVSEQLRNRFLKEDLTVDELNALMNEFIEAVRVGDWKARGWVGTTYGVSKIGMTMLGRIWTKQLPAGILINSVCPGYVKTNMAPNGIRTIDQGALTPVHVALLPTSAKENGLFWANEKVQPYF